MIPSADSLPRQRLRLRACTAFAAVLLLFSTGFAAAQAGLGGGARNQVQVELIAEPTTVRPGEPFWALLRMRIAPQWHTYWMNPGDSGLATVLEWQLPEAVTAGPLQWPVPRRLPVGPLMNYGYENEVLLPVRIDVPAQFAATVLRVSASAQWLVCKEVCIPESAPVGFELPVAPIAALPDPRHAAAFAAARRALPGTLDGWSASAMLADGHLRIALKAPEGSAFAPGEVYFYNGLEGQVAHARPQTVSVHRDGLLVEVPLMRQPVAPVERMSGLLVANGGFGPGQPPAALVDAPLSTSLPDLGPRLSGPTTTATDTAGRVAATIGSDMAPPIGLLVALLLAVAGGIILNLMPCVFPVLSIKALSMVERASNHPGELRAHGLAFSAGVLATFWALAAALMALRAGGEQIGWGFQLQSPPFIAAMAVLFTLIALNLAGVFETGLRIAATAGNVGVRQGHSGSFLTGVLAVAVAAPCTAPFMGAALGYAIVQPAPVAFAVFGALAFGMALPYLLLSFVPGLARFLPRPGRWMITFRQAMVFPLLGTVAWLAWVLGMQSGNDAVFGLLAGLVVVAFAAWIYGRFMLPSGSLRRQRAAAAATLVFALAGGYLAWPAADAGPVQSAATDEASAWQPWSVAEVERHRTEGRPVFIDFTAAWCVTCQANKQLVLDTAAVSARMAELGVVRLRADWTRRDRAISEALAGYGRSGVPVYVLYLPGRVEPMLLPELLTREIVLTALAQAGGKKLAGHR